LANSNYSTTESLLQQNMLEEEYKTIWQVSPGTSLVLYYILNVFIMLVIYCTLCDMQV
jgi:hypothetical protein